MVIQRLARRHDRRGFDCGEESLNRFLREVARQDADRDLGVTWVLVPEPDSPHILGFYTLVMGSVPGDIVPEKGIPAQRAIPVVLLGRLAVDRTAQGQGLGERLLFHALYMAQQASWGVTAYAVVVDALHEQARAFYLHYGFHALVDDPLHLFITLKVIRQLNLQPRFEKDESGRQSFEEAKRSTFTQYDDALQRMADGE